MGDPSKSFELFNGTEGVPPAFLFNRFCFELVAGGMPAVPVKSLNLSANP
jgi:hypothetical protein